MTTKGVEDGMGAKQRVLAVWPEAICMHSATGEMSIWSTNDFNTCEPLSTEIPEAVIRFFPSEEQAWADAASQLPAMKDEVESVEDGAILYQANGMAVYRENESFKVVHQGDAVGRFITLSIAKEFIVGRAIPPVCGNKSDHFGLSCTLAGDHGGNCYDELSSVGKNCSAGVWNPPAQPMKDEVESATTDEACDRRATATEAYWQAKQGDDYGTY